MLGRSRALLFALFLFAAVSARAETKIRSLTGIINGHSVGGVTVDAVGDMVTRNFRSRIVSESKGAIWIFPLTLT